MSPCPSLRDMRIEDMSIVKPSRNGEDGGEGHGQGGGENNLAVVEIEKSDHSTSFI